MTNNQHARKLKKKTKSTKWNFNQEEEYPAPPKRKRVSPKFIDYLGVDYKAEFIRMIKADQLKNK